MASMAIGPWVAVGPVAISCTGDSICEGDDLCVCAPVDGPGSDTVLGGPQVIRSKPPAVACRAPRTLRRCGAGLWIFLDWRLPKCSHRAGSARLSFASWCSGLRTRPPIVFGQSAAVAGSAEMTSGWVASPEGTGGPRRRAGRYMGAQVCGTRRGRGQLLPGGPAVYWPDQGRLEAPVGLTVTGRGQVLGEKSVGSHWVAGPPPPSAHWLTLPPIFACRASVSGAAPPHLTRSRLQSGAMSATTDPHARSMRAQVERS